MLTIKAGPASPNSRTPRNARRSARWRTGVLALSLLTGLSLVPAAAGASTTVSGAASHASVRTPWKWPFPWPPPWKWPGPGKGGRPPGTRDYQVSILATWNIPSGSVVTFSPAGENCTDGPLYGGSFTTEGDHFQNVISLMTADQGFSCLFQFTRGIWQISVRKPDGATTSVRFVDEQVGPLTYEPICSDGTPTCVGVPRPLVPLSSVVFSY
jgi:hypothetical protein